MTPTGTTKPELERLGRKLVRLGGKQVLLIAHGGRVFAIANRCPHEGYPLSEGTLGQSCVITCNWHNWKFDLASGEALIGFDPVRTFPLAVRGQESLVDLTDPPAEAQRARALAGLEVALDYDDRARMARETARLERAGYDGRLALAHAILRQNERLEGGMTHAHAAAPDWLSLAARAQDPDLRLTAVLEPIAHLARDTLGAGAFPYAEGSAAWDAAAFVDAVEREDEAVATRLVRGALEAQVPYAEMRPAFAAAALAHYNDFGHSAIYVLKAGQIIEALGESVQPPMLLALTRSLAQARREDLIPEFRGYPGAVAAWGEAGAEPVSADDLRGVSVNGGLDRLLRSGKRTPSELFDALVAAASWNMAHFDLGFDSATDNPIADNVGWLDFTHALTFASAARRLCEETPALWPKALAQLVLFIGRNKPYVDAALDTDAWRVDETERFIADERGALYDHGIAEPIIACHRLKVLTALEDEWLARPDSSALPMMATAVNRYLNSPLKIRHGLRTARQARAFVAQEG
ncbi:MAG TPA: Rieske 2Fe-2S domain-containing protein [Caulobacteraceae bacterium]|nr:Rieske 2Fe-2S domain-containing protein [Caulobacteraceae bacterium]